MKKVSVYTSFATFPATYEAAFSDAAGANGFFFSSPWFRNFAATAVEQGTKLRIYGLEPESGNETPYLALAMCHEERPRNPFAPRKLSALANFYTPLFGPIIGSGCQDVNDAFHRIAKAMADERPRWDIVDLHPIDADSPVSKDIMRALRRAGMAVQCYFCHANWYLEVGGRSYQDYFRSLPSQLRNTLKRKTAQLEASDRLRIDIVVGGDGLDAALAGYQTIYASSWKVPEHFDAFIPGLVRAAAEQGALRLGVAYIDNKPAAAQLWIVYNGAASIYKLAYDAQFSKHSVGSILTARLMEHVIEVDQVREVDFLTGDDPYKRDWMSHRRERQGIIAFNLLSVRGALGAATNFGGRAVKSALRFGRR